MLSALNHLAYAHMVVVCGGQGGAPCISEWPALPAHRTPTASTKKALHLSMGGSSNGSGDWVPATHVGDLNGVPSSCPGPAGLSYDQVNGLSLGI